MKRLCSFILVICVFFGSAVNAFAIDTTVNVTNHQLDEDANEIEEDNAEDITENTEDNESFIDVPILKSISIQDDKTVGEISDNAIATYRFFGTDLETIISTQLIKSGDILYSPSTPEKQGYTFIGWSTISDGTNVDVQPFDYLEMEEQENGKYINYYPVFKQKLFVFFYHPNGSILQTKEGITGDTITTDDVSFQLDSEYQIEGWYLDSDYTQKADSFILDNTNMYLYPKVIEGHYITFFRAIGATYYEPQFVSLNDVTKDPGTPTRKGYSFQGWTTNEGSIDANFTFGDELTDDITLYAIWRAEETTYTVRILRQNVSDDKNATDDEKTYTV